MNWRISLDRWRKGANEPIPQTSVMERALIAKHRFLRQASVDPEQASLTFGQLPFPVALKALTLILADLAHRTNDR